MSNSVTILQASSGEALARWTALQQRAVTTHAFCDLEMVGGLAAAQDLEMRAIFIGQQEIDSAAFLATFRQVGPFLEVVPPRLIPFSPLLVADAGTPDSYAAVLDSLRAHLVDRYHRVVITLPPDSPQLLQAMGDSWKRDVLQTYVSELREDNTNIVAGWSAATRRLYRKNVGAYRVREDESSLPSVIQLWLDGYARSGKQIQVDANLLAGVVTATGAPLKCRVFTAVAREGGLLEGGVIVLEHGNVAYYWIAGSIPGPAMTVLVGNVLTRLQQDGITAFDFLGANTPSIAEFKRRFGPTLVDYPRLVASRSRVFETMLSAKRTLSERTARL